MANEVGGMERVDTPTMEQPSKRPGTAPRGPSGGGGGHDGAGDGGSARGPSPPRPGGGGFFEQYKPDQGKGTRMGTLIGGGALVAWGAWFLYERLQVFEGDEAWRLLITPGIPILCAVVFGAAVWWVSFVHRASSDFMIATEGEMKKVSWSTRREVVGSTKVVIVFTLLVAFFLFVVDIGFQSLFEWFGVLKR